MDATDQTASQTKNHTLSRTAGRNGGHPDLPGDGPLGVPVRRLREGLDALARAGHLRGAELTVPDPVCPCFLVDVAPGLPRLYVEVFLDDSPEASDPEASDPDEEGRPLLVLVNWLGEDTDPAIFELDPSLLEGDPSRLGPALAPVLDHVLWMAQDRA